jgi:(p)ppGpp synthase/HD superfamily hydrolase
VAKRFFSPSPEKAIRAVCEGRLVAYLSEEAIDEVIAAFQFAEKAHRGQTRQTGEHYIHHPIEVANALAELQMDSRSIIAALLHDVIEDTSATKEDI